ncbi:hypothetical protein N658DRAFT_312063 [Parathielavia hyrcaniae]|uniref:Uncharacterized protein n=1 Tax=Parathielavia hyrcaniae TaxID=113614 RepID=A0AAN6PW16_9PEZI|nr:hypothetical protein N658DRAFT_312063 [Parathielavia hyrcaniae]
MFPIDGSPSTPPYMRTCRKTRTDIQEREEVSRKPIIWVQCRFDPGIQCNAMLVHQRTKEMLQKGGTPKIWQHHRRQWNPLKSCCHPSIDLPSTPFRLLYQPSPHEGIGATPILPYRLQHGAKLRPPQDQRTPTTRQLSIHTSVCVLRLPSAKQHR